MAIVTVLFFSSSVGAFNNAPGAANDAPSVVGAANDAPGVVGAANNAPAGRPGKEAQAAVAFLSGFLVVLFLQHLAERGNVWLGRWREQYAYEPSEIAKELGLTRDEDNRLGKADLTHLSQLAWLQGESQSLAQVSKIAGLEGHFLKPLANRAKRIQEEKDIQRKIGNRMWDELRYAEVDSVYDLAGLSKKAIEDLKIERIDRDHLCKLKKMAEDFVYRTQGDELAST